MSLPNPRVSIVIPAYNAAGFLPEAIADVHAQALPCVEVIVIDDGSTDDTPALLAALGMQVRTARQPNRGPAAARNHGLDLARGEFIAFHDADDLWAPGALSALLTHLDAHPGVDIAQGLIQRLVLARPAPGEPPAHQPSGPPYQFVNLASALYRRRAFDRAGRLDESLRANEDTDFYLRAWERGVPKDVLPRVVLLYRLHGRNCVYAQDHVGGGLPLLFKRHLERLRRGQVCAGAARPDLHSYLGPLPPALPRLDLSPDGPGVPALPASLPCEPRP